jgi:hypothetical protein
MSATSEDRPAAHPATKDAEMGLFDKAKRELGMVDKKLLANGILARGNVVSAVPDGMTIGQDANLVYGAEKVCRVVLEVIGLSGEEPYEATCKHSIPLIYIPKLQEQGAAVAIRVDPDDPQHIELDLGSEVPPAPVILVSDDGS